MSKATTMDVTLFYQRFQGLCRCETVISTKVVTHIRFNRGEEGEILDKPIGELNPYRCPQSDQDSFAIEPISIDLVDEEVLLIVIPEQLVYRASKCYAEQLDILGSHHEIDFKPYFFRPEIVISSESLASVLTLRAAEAVETKTHIPPVDVSPPAISPLPDYLANNDIELPPGLETEISNSPTQVNTTQNLARSTSSATNKRSFGLDALIDSALSDTETPPPVELATTDKVSEFHRDSTALIPVSTEVTSEESETDVSEEPDYDPATIQDHGPTPTRLLYAQTVRRFDNELAKGSSRYVDLGDDGVVELFSKVDERHAERWITDDLDVRLQLHTIDRRGAPCLTLYTLVDGKPQDELFWPIKVDESIGPKILRSLRRSFRLELTLFKKNGNFYGQRIIEAPLEENAAYLINRIKDMKMTHSAAASVRTEIETEIYDRDGQMSHPFSKESFTDIESAKDALLSVGIWSYWSTIKQRDYLIFIKSFPIPWLRRLQHRVLKSAIEFGVSMPANLQSQSIALGLVKSDVELLQKTIAHFVEVNIQLRSSDLSHLELWENWDALLTQLDELGIDADEEVEQLAFQAMQRIGLSQEFEEDFAEDEETSSQGSAADAKTTGSSFDDFEDLSDISEIKELDMVTEVPPLPSVDDDFSDAELISEEFIEEEYLTDEGDAFLLIDDMDIVEEDIVDPQTAGIGEVVLEMEAPMQTQILVSNAIEHTSKNDKVTGT